MKRSMSKLFTFGLALAMIVSFLPAAAQPAEAVSTTIVISQVYGGGGNSGAFYKNDFIELYNLGATPISVAGWSLQYASATGSGNFGSAANMITPLSGSIPPGKYILVQEAAGAGGIINLPTPDITDPTPIGMSGTDGKVALVNTTTPLGCNGGSNPCSASALATIVDLVGYGTANFFEGHGAAPQLSNTTADFRNGDGSVDTDNNDADFTRGSPNPRNSQYPFAAIGLATPPAILAGGSTLLTVIASPAVDPPSTGLSVSCNLTAIGGAASQLFFDDGTHGDVLARDNVFSFSVTVASAKVYNLACNLSDAQGRNTTTVITIAVVVVQPIGTVNGEVLDTDNGTDHVSPSAGKYVAVQGVIYEKTLQAISGSTNTYKGFFIQNTTAKADGLANTSDGLFVFMNTDDTLPEVSGTYTPTVGDEIVLVGKVSEYYSMTELVGSFLVPTIVNNGVSINAVVANPPANLADANRYWERLQGMRVQVPQDSIVLGGRNVFSPADAEIWLARSDSTIATRTGPLYNDYTKRAFRDANALDDNYNLTSWDGNGYRILMGSLGIKALPGNDAQTLIDPARTFDTLTNAPIGGLNYTFSKYRIEVTEQPSFSEGVDPAANNPVQAVADRGTSYSIADYNLENLYDFRNNPFSGCDFAGDSGCPMVAPFLAAVNPPYDYVPASEEAYQARLNDISLQIINDLHNPDILMVQEVENQDICTVTDGAMDCGTTDNKDGKPDVLQELALTIAANGGPAYDAAFDRDSSDLRGILPAFLYRTDRVKLVSPEGNPILSGNPLIGSYTTVPNDADVSNPKTLNAVLPSGVTACETDWVFPRAPAVALFRVSSINIGGGFQDVYVINNHFKSTPDSCVGHRTEQAKYNAALVAYIQAYNPVARIVVGGDLNVYPLPDNTSYGATSQLASLYGSSLSLTNLWDVINANTPASAYSYVYLGMAQTLDQMFINKPMMADLQDFRISHINSDFPADFLGDVARGTSDHDPNVATFGINFNGFFPPIANTPTFNLSSAGSAIPVKFSLDGFKGLAIFAEDYPQSKQIACDVGADENTISQTVTAGKSNLSYDVLTDQYSYNWKTDKDWAGTCRMLVVMLNDGTGQVAFFHFK